jgi:hypothetical protein
MHRIAKAAEAGDEAAKQELSDVLTGRKSVNAARWRDAAAPCHVPKFGAKR